MKKAYRIVMVALAIVMVMCCTVPALAAEASVAATMAEADEVVVATEPAEISSTPRYVQHARIGSEYVMVIGTDVRNKTVQVSVLDEWGEENTLKYNPSDYQVDIMVNGADGLIWKSHDWMGSGSSNSFWIGTDVTGVWIRVIPRNKLLFPAPARFFDVQITC